jgi:hypothetical protein
MNMTHQSKTEAMARLKVHVLRGAKMALCAIRVDIAGVVLA